MTINELTKKVASGDQVTYGEAKELLAGHEVYNDGVYNFDNCILSCNSLDDSAVLYHPYLS